MRISIVIGLLLTLGCVQSVQAEVPGATCAEYLTGYTAISPFKREDLERVADVLIENHLFVNDASRQQYATREQMIAEMRTHNHGPEFWIYEFDEHLERRLKALGCAYEARRLIVMAPPPVTPTCKARVPDLSKPYK